MSSSVLVNKFMLGQKVIKKLEKNDGDDETIFVINAIVRRVRNDKEQIAYTGKDFGWYEESRLDLYVGDSYGA